MLTSYGQAMSCWLAGQSVRDKKEQERQLENAGVLADCTPPEWNGHWRKFLILTGDVIVAVERDWYAGHDSDDEQGWSYAQTPISNESDLAKISEKWSVSPHIQNKVRNALRRFGNGEDLTT